MAAMAAPRRLQLTLALLKPDAVAHPLVCEAVHAAILRHRFLIVRAKELRWGPEQSRRFYREHAGRFFYQRLVEFMASGPMWAYILAHENAVPLWRSLMGPTKVFRARHSDPESIRGAYGLTDTRNTTHGSGPCTPGQVPLESSSVCGGSLASVSLPFPLLGRLAGLGQQGDRLFLPRVRRAALAGAGGAALAARGAAVQRLGARAPPAGAGHRLTQGHRLTGGSAQTDPGGSGHTDPGAQDTLTRGLGTD